MRLNWTSLLGGIAIAFGLLVGAVFFVVSPHLESREIARQVEEVLQTPQTYDGEVIDNLARLGPDTIPAIGEVLTDDYQWPVTLVYALREIGDPRGAEPILSFVRSRTPYSDTESSSITAEAIRVLGSIPNPIVCEPLTEIFEDASSHPRLRLASAATVFRSCDGEAAAAAEGLLLELWNNRRDYGRVVNEGFHWSEAFTALVAAAESDEIAIILIGLMNADPSHDIVPRIIEAIDGQKAGFTDALLVVLNAPSPDIPFETRLMAAQRLLPLSERPNEALRARMEELLAEAEANGYPAELVEEARQLRRNSESQLVD